MVLPIDYHMFKRKVLLILHLSLPMGKAYIIETCTSAPYIKNHCDDITPEPQVRPLTHTFLYDIYNVFNLQIIQIIPRTKLSVQSIKTYSS